MPLIPQILFREVSELFDEVMGKYVFFLSLYSESLFVTILKYSEISKAYALKKKSSLKLLKIGDLKINGKPQRNYPLLFFLCGAHEGGGRVCVLLVSTWHFHFDFLPPGLLQPLVSHRWLDSDTIFPVWPCAMRTVGLGCLDSLSYRNT